MRSRDRETVDLFSPFAPAATSSRGIKWSDQQIAIFEYFRSGRGNLVVRARAGTGKTTTILEGVKHAPERRILITAFNKHSAEDLRKKNETHRAKAKTLHSVGYGYVRNRFTNLGEPDEARGFSLAREASLEVCERESEAGRPVTQLEPTEVSAVKRLASWLKNVHPHGLPDTQEGLRQLLWHVPLPETMAFGGWSDELFVECAVKSLLKSLVVTDTIDFDDMLFLPLYLNLLTSAYDLVVVDEAQDMNCAQLLIAERVLAPGGRIVVVGDDRQGIYGFRGADSGALDRLKAHYKAAELPLTVTRRCPKKVVERAAALVPDFEAAPDAPEGVLTSCASITQAVKLAAPGDFVLSRLNAPLVPICLQLLKAGKQAYVLGREIGKDLKEIAAKVADGPYDKISDFLPALGEWSDAQADKWRKAATSPNEKVARKAIRKLAEIMDQAEVLIAISGADDVKTVKDLYVKLARLFCDNDDDDKKDLICCSSVHRIKGKEADRVFLIEEAFYVYGKLRGDPEEENIEYVAITRAKRELVSVGKQVTAASARY